MSSEYRDFLELSYAELEEKNLAAKKQRKDRVPAEQIEAERVKYLTEETRIKAVMVVFSDLEGRLHMLDYDKKFLVKSYDNLTFDGSSIRGFTAQRESDLRLALDWGSFYWVPADVFGSGQGADLWRGDRQERLALLRRYPRRPQELRKRAVRKERL